MSSGLDALDVLKLRLSSQESNKILCDVIRKELQALEIIRNMRILSPYETCGGKCWLETMVDAIAITKENYDLLKEVLE